MGVFPKEFRQMLIKGTGNAVLIIAGGHFIGKPLDLLQSVSHRDAQPRVAQHGHVVLSVACAIYRMQQGDEMPQNLNRAKIIKRHKRFYNDLKDFLKPLEEKFQITFGDDELAHIISVVKQI